MEVLFLYWCINFTILWCCKVTYYNFVKYEDDYESYNYKLNNFAATIGLVF